MRNRLFSLALLLLGSMISSAQTCKTTQYDMLDWMAPVQSTMNGHYNVVLPNAGTFYWVKSSNGYPWDVDTFDSQYIYQSITEQDWSNPSTYKIFQVALPWMPRCIDVPVIPGKLASITVLLGTHVDDKASRTERFSMLIILLETPVRFTRDRKWSARCWVGRQKAIRTEARPWARCASLGDWGYSMRPMRSNTAVSRQLGRSQGQWGRCRQEILQRGVRLRSR